MTTSFNLYMTNPESSEMHDESTGLPGKNRMKPVIYYSK